MRQIYDETIGLVAARIFKGRKVKIKSEQVIVLANYGAHVGPTAVHGLRPTSEFVSHHIIHQTWSIGSQISIH